MLETCSRLFPVFRRKQGFTFSLKHWQPRWGVRLMQVFTFQLESDLFPQILRQFIQRFSLSHDGQVEALGDELILASENMDLDNCFSSCVLVTR